jgi:hypothetical protein
LKNQDYFENQKELKSHSKIIPEVFYPADEASKLLDMIQPVLGEARRLAKENPGEYPIFEWFLRSFQLCYQESASPGL